MVKVKFFLVVLLGGAISCSAADIDTVSSQLVDINDALRVIAIFICLLFGLCCWFATRIK